MSRDYVLLYINGERHEVRGEHVFLPLANYLRYERRLTGTKIVCAEGDCGACTVLKSAEGKTGFRGVNSCIAPVFLMDGSHIVTVEGLSANGELTEVQEAMVRCFGSQCGFCTPGFVMALTDMFERTQSVNQSDIKNHLTGNLCRCTGYQPIIEAAQSVQGSRVKPVQDRYGSEYIAEDLAAASQQEVRIECGDQIFFGPISLDAALRFKEEHGQSARIYSGATDLGVQDNKRAAMPQIAMSLHLLKDLYQIREIGGCAEVGARVNLRALEEFSRTRLPALANFLKIFASPQIKEAATLVGNLGNGSPIADTLPFLYVSDAEVLCRSLDGERRVAIEKWFKGYKQFDLKANEIITAVSFRIPEPEQLLALYKVSQRRDLDISCVNAAVLADGSKDRIESVRIAYGGVGPTTLRATNTERAMIGKALNATTLEACKSALAGEIGPIDDVRGTRWFRLTLATNLLKKFANEWTNEKQ